MIHKNLRFGQHIVHALVDGPCPDIFYATDEKMREVVGFGWLRLVPPDVLVRLIGFSMAKYEKSQQRFMDPFADDELDLARALEAEMTRREVDGE